MNMEPKTHMERRGQEHRALCGASANGALVTVRHREGVTCQRCLRVLEAAERVRADRQRKLARQCVRCDRTLRCDRTRRVRLCAMCDTPGLAPSWRRVAAEAAAGLAPSWRRDNADT